MARIIAIANRKGGVGKTTTAVSLGAALAGRGRRVLVVDLDSQQNLCVSLRVRAPKPGLGDVLFSQLLLGVGSLGDVLVEAGDFTIVGGFDLELTDAQMNCYGTGWEHALQMALEPESSRFDFVLLDCSPSLGCLTVNALTAADQVLVPVQTEFLAVSQLASIMAAVERVRATTNPRIGVAGFLPTLFDARTRHSVEVLMRISTEADRYRARVFRPIPRTVRVAEAAARGEPISRYAPRSDAAIAYESLAIELERDSRKGLAPCPVSTMEERPSMERSQAFWERIAADAILRQRSDGGDHPLGWTHLSHQVAFTPSA